jgi:hypothetical protein
MLRSIRQQQWHSIRISVNIVNDCSICINQYIHVLPFLSSLGYLLRVPIKRIQQCLLNTLYKSIQSTNRSPIASNDYDGLKPTSINYLLRTQLTSDLCETLVKVNNIVRITWINMLLSFRHSLLSNMILHFVYISWNYYKYSHWNHVRLPVDSCLWSLVSLVFLAECVARMLTYDCVSRLVIRMNDADSTGESVLYRWLSSSLSTFSIVLDFCFVQLKYSGICSNMAMLDK